MKIYIATSFKNKEGFRKLRDVLVENGHEVTHDWTNDSIEGLDEAEKKKALSEYAMRCIRGIDQCEAFVLIAHPDMGGALVEMGIAIGHLNPVIVMNEFGEGVRENIFYHLPQQFYFQSANNVETLLQIIAPAPVVEAPKGVDPVNN